MIPNVILDTGPLVAFLVEGELSHDWTVSQFQNIQSPMRTCEAVLTEACFLLRNHSEAIERIRGFLKEDSIRVDFSLSQHSERVFELMHAYRDVPMSLADACLVRMVEIDRDSQILTLDGDFRIYRQQRRKLIPLLIP